jgi:hypothetical protein
MGETTGTGRWQGWTDQCYLHCGAGNQSAALNQAGEWRLLNRHAASLAEANELIDWYRARWEIEMLFDILKNACRVEALQLSGIDKLERALAIFMVVAWRIAHLMCLGRTCPDLEATAFFDWAEIKAAYLLTKVAQPENPRLNEVLRLIARRGGFLGRKSDGEPGVKTIWNGLMKVCLVAEALREAHSTYG